MGARNWQYISANVIVISSMMIAVLAGVWELPFRIFAARETIGFSDRIFGPNSRIATTLDVLIAVELRKSAADSNQECKICPVVAPLCRNLLVRCERLNPVPESLYVKCANTLFACVPTYPHRNETLMRDVLNVHTQVLRIWGRDTRVLLSICPDGNEALLNFLAGLYAHTEDSRQKALLLSCEAMRLGKLHSVMLPQYRAFEIWRAVGEHYLNSEQPRKSIFYQSMLLRNIPGSDKEYVKEQRGLILHRIKTCELVMSGKIGTCAYCAYNSNMLIEDKPEPVDYIE